MAYKDNILEYYGGGSVPFRQGYQRGGGVIDKIKQALTDDKGLFRGERDKEWFKARGTGHSWPIEPHYSGEQPPTYKFGMGYEGARPLNFEGEKSHFHGLLGRLADRRLKKDLEGIATDFRREYAPQGKGPYSAQVGKDWQTGDPTLDLKYRKSYQPWSEYADGRFEEDLDRRRLKGEFRTDELIDAEKAIRGYSFEDREDVDKWMAGQGRPEPSSYEKRAEEAFLKREISPKNIMQLLKSAVGKQEGGFIPSWSDYKKGVGATRMMERQAQDPLENVKLGLGAVGNVPGLGGIAADVASAGLSIGQGRFKEGLGSLAAAADPTGAIGAFSTGSSLLGKIMGKQYGGEVSYMQSGGLAAIARARKVKEATEDVERRAKEMQKKQGRSGLWGKIGELGGKAIGTFFGGNVGGSIGAGLGRGLGAKLGYGDKVGSGLEDTKWLAGSRKELGKAEKGLDKSFFEQGIAAGGKQAIKSGIESGAFKDLGADIKQKLNWKPDEGKVPMGGMPSSKLGDISAVGAGSPVGYEGSGGFDLYRPPTFEGFGEGTKNLGGFGGTDFAAQLESNRLLNTPTLWPKDMQTNLQLRRASSFPFKKGGAVRDDMALIDMLYGR